MKKRLYISTFVFNLEYRLSKFEQNGGRNELANVRSESYRPLSLQERPSCRGEIFYNEEVERLSDCVDVLILFKTNFL